MPTITRICAPISCCRPFCPFRSAACGEGGALDEGMVGLSSKAPRFMTELSRLQLAMQAGESVDPDHVRSVARDLNEAQDDWEALLGRMGMSEDFQSREYRKISVAQLEGQGQDLQSIGRMIRWQADCMVAYADGRPPPFPPAGVDLQKMMEQAQSGGGSPMSAMGAGTAITSVRQLESRWNACISWSRTGGRVSWSRTGGFGSLQFGCHERFALKHSLMLRT
jgi:hypothetical protein